MIERIRAEWRHAFAMQGEEAGWDDDERELVARLADFVVRRRLSAPALMSLEAGRPLNYVGSQVLTFLAPFATLVFSRREYERFARLLERRQSIDLIIEAIARREGEERSNG